MTAPTTNPVRDLVHKHRELNALALEVGQLLRAAAKSAAARKTLASQLEMLRDELLAHFADEEEGLFPFMRANAPAMIEGVERLEAAHDTICGAVVRLAFLAGRKHDAAVRASLDAAYRRFEEAYAAHSRDEAALLDKLGRSLTASQHAELADLLRGLG